jgi:LacI family transcriptional regulator
MRTLFSQVDVPEAVFINNNLLTLGALLEMRELGLECTKDIGIVSFDDHPWAAVSCPPLTVVRQPTRKLGQAAAEMILALINEHPVVERRVVLDCELIRRQSCRSLESAQELIK